MVPYFFLPLNLFIVVKIAINNIMFVYNMNLKKLLSHIKSSAKRRNLDFNLTEAYLMDLSFPLICPILDVPICYDRSKGLRDFGPSIDRIDNDLGYVQGNISVISVRANRAKNNLSEKELKQFSLYYQNT